MSATASVVRVASASLVQLLLTGAGLAALAAFFLTQAVERAVGRASVAWLLAGIVAAAALAVLPLLALRREGRLLRALGLLLSASSRRLGDGPLLGRADVLTALEAVAHAHAQELEDARRNVRALRERERAIGRVLDQIAPPSFGARLRGLDVAGFSRARGRAGGDFYVVRPLDERHVLLALGDVAGHDPASAYAAAALSGALRVLSPALLLGQLDLALGVLEELLEELASGTLTSSCVLVVVDRSTWQMRYANAGHPAPWILRAERKVASLPASSGPLGLPREHPPVVEALQLAPDDRLLFFSDGVLEQADPLGRLFGARRMLASTEKALHAPSAPTSHELLAELVEAFQGFAGPAGASDDASMVVCRLLDEERGGIGDDKTEVNASTEGWS